MNSTKWLNCSASQGQFREEVAIQGHDFNGHDFSLFTSRQFVRWEREPTNENEVPARLQILLIEKRDNLCLIRLPGRTFDNGSTVTVRHDQLVECATPEYA